ncbi:collagen-like protein [Acinetobacter tianfuensis]|uniref:Collagen-like protein n=1 Tax=Acinetobacter tianfuensis TaxID=2419603 RepID=A0A3A8EFC7_9GAMM|nr:collagen-like protein [Acinetobacter tianfuensis]RKG32798.1 collagen-like protein [Acinetobacter tianfuensis]
MQFNVIYITLLRESNETLDDKKDKGMNMILKSLFTQACSKSKKLSDKESERRVTVNCSAMSKNTEYLSGFSARKVTRGLHHMPELLLLSSMLAFSGGAWATLGEDAHHSNGAENGQGHEEHGNGNGNGHEEHSGPKGPKGEQGPVGPAGPQGPE